MELWNSKTKYRKIMIILLMLHLIGCFVLPLATMRGSAKSLNALLRYVGADELPKRMTLWGLIRLELAINRESEAMFFMAIMAGNLLSLPIHIFGKKRASYVGTLCIWLVLTVLEAPTLSVAGSISGYDGNPLGSLLIILGFAVIIVSIVGIACEKKASEAQTARGTLPAKGSVKVNRETMEKIGNQAGSALNTLKAAVVRGAKSEAVTDVKRKLAGVKETITSGSGTNTGGSGTNTGGSGAIAGGSGTNTGRPGANTGGSGRITSANGTITGVKGSFAGARIPMNSGEELIIGRNAEHCHIILEGPTVSSRHCTVQYDAATGYYNVVDYSTNGTFLKSGERLPLRKKMALAPGTILVIGNGENSFQLG